MKKIIYLLIAAACALPVAGCSELDMDLDTNGGKGLEFIHFLTSSGSILAEEDKPETQKFTTTVSITALSDKDRTFNVKLGDKTTGVEGTDFTMTNKKLTIPANKYAGTISFNIDYENISEQGFKVELLLDVDADQLSPAFGNACLVTVKSDKVTIDWNWLLGAWSASDDGADPYLITITKVDETRLTIDNFWDGGEVINATVDFEALTLSIDADQVIYDYPNNGFVRLRYCDPATKTVDETKPIMCSMSPLGISVSLYNASIPTLPHDFGNGTSAFTR